MGDQAKIKQLGKTRTLDNDLETGTLNSLNHGFTENELTDTEKDTKKIEEDLKEDLKGFKTI